jgi:hypothetical protein
MWGGIVLSFPLLVTVLPLCIFLIVATFTAPFWVPIYELRVRLHGAPFKTGDHVRIVRGEHRGKVVAVRDVWADRHELRVDLGEGNRADYSDVFSFLKVRRVPESEQGAPPNSRPRSPLLTSPDIQTSDPLRTPSSGGCG